ncbi:MAG: hypothetical protein JNK15_00200 [Planctomycetes bacterium]|nr:hypothetical protein [Planctomycetota bacterium]
MKNLLPVALPLLFAGLASAQKMNAADGSGRIVQVFDLHELRPVDPDEPDQPAKPGLPTGEIRATSPGQHVADALRRFVDPPLGADDDLRGLGSRWLVMLGSPEQLASFERLWRAAQKRKEDVVDVQLRLYTIDAKKFAAIKDKLVAVERPGGIGYEMVAADKQATAIATALEAADGDSFEAPRLAVFPLQNASMSVKDQTSYVKDFTLTRVGDQAIADPVVDIVWDGYSIEVISTWLPDGLLGVSIDVQVQDLQRPIPKFETTLQAGLPPVQIQLPRVTGLRLRQTAALAKDSLAVLAASKADGKWIVATMRATALK